MVSSAAQKNSKFFLRLLVSSVIGYAVISTVALNKIRRLGDRLVSRGYYTFVGPHSQHAPPSTVVRRSAKLLELPEVNYFTRQDIVKCIEEGCSIEESTELEHKLARDEERIQSEIETLDKAAILDHSKNIERWGAELRHHLSGIHDLHHYLRASMGQLQDAAKGQTWPSISIGF